MVSVKGNWQIWKKKPSVEQRTFLRVKGSLKEMESAKQLREIIKKIYKPEMHILDVGCAAGHYYHSLRRIDKNIKYTGIDSTKDYIRFGKKFFDKNKNVSLSLGNIFDLNKKFKKNYDITFCCNLLLHLPSIEIPIRNLLQTSKKFCIIRTLLSNKSHLSKFLYTDSFNSKNDPKDFVYQNTYSYDFIKKVINKNGRYKIRFIKDDFNAIKVNNEFNMFKKKQQGVTKAINNLQVSGSKVFEWKWVLITKT